MSFAVAAPACSLRAAPRSPLRRRCVSRALRVRASVHEEEPREGLGRYLARAAASLFAPADDHGVRFPLVPYDGRPLRAADRKKLARFEQVVRTTRDTLDAMPHDAPAGSKQHQDIGHWLAEAAATVFTKPEADQEKIFKGTLSGWSGEVGDRKRVVARLDAFRSHVSELKDAAPQRDDDDDAK